MVKKHLLLLMFLCVCRSAGAMDMSFQSPGYRIMPLKQLKEILASPTRLIPGDAIIVYSTQDDSGIIVEKEVYQKSETIKVMFTDITGNIIPFEIGDKSILSSQIKQIFDLLKLYDSEQSFEQKTACIKHYTNNIGLSDFAKFYKYISYLMVDDSLLDILREVYRDKIIQYFKNKLILREATGPFTVYSSPKGISNVAFSPNDTLIAAGGAESKGDKNFVIKNISAVDWNDFDANDVPTVLEAELSSVCVLDFFSNTEINVGLSAVKDNIVLWSDISDQNLRKNKSIPVKRPFTFKRIAEKEYFFGCGKEDNLLKFGVEGRVVNNFSALAPSPLGGITRVTINPIGRLLASVSASDHIVGKKLFLWNTQTEENKKITYNGSYQLHSGLQNIHAITFSPDGNWLVAAGQRGAANKKKDKKNISLFDIYNVWQRKQLYLNFSKQFGDSSKIISAEFSADSKWIISVGENRVAIWDVETGDLLKQFVDIKDCVSVALSHDSRKLLVGCTNADNSLIVWELFTQQEFYDLEQIRQCNDQQITLLSQLCTNKSFDFNSDDINIYNGLSDAIRSFLLKEISGLSDAINTLKGEQEVVEEVSIEEPPMVPVEIPVVNVPQPEPEGWTWKQRAAIALGFGATAAIVGYQWYQKWNKMKH